MVVCAILQRNLVQEPCHQDKYIRTNLSQTHQGIEDHVAEVLGRLILQMVCEHANRNVVVAEK